RLRGRAPSVVGGATASLLVVAAHDERGSVTACAVRPGAPGVRVTPLRLLNPPAQPARIDFSDAEVADADVLAGAAGAAVVEAAVDALAVASVAELCGAA